MQVFVQEFFVRETKELIIRTTLGEPHTCCLRVLPEEIFNFRLSEIASGGFWGPRRLVAEMLLQVE